MCLLGMPYAINGASEIMTVHEACLIILAQLVYAIVSTHYLSYPVQKRNYVHYNLSIQLQKEVEILIR